jgi:hypothetical protein
MDQQTSSNPTVSDKAIKFRHLAERRMTKLLTGIQRLGNLSRRTTYAYSAPEIEQMFKTLRAGLDEAEAKFAEQKATVFRFD